MMTYGRIPLYPALRPGGDGCGCVALPLCDDGPCCPPPCGETQRVTLRNPCRPGERVEVLLGVDDCGNLNLCVRRESDCCPPREHCRPRPCRVKKCGRLYGNWGEE